MRNIVRIVVVLSALGSLACTIYAGQHNRSVLLVGMFAVWVVAPFAGLLFVLRPSASGPSPAATSLQSICMILSLAGLAIFAVFALRPLVHQAAAPFLVVPFCLWIGVAGLALGRRRA